MPTASALEEGSPSLALRNAYAYAYAKRQRDGQSTKRVTFHSGGADPEGFPTAI